MINRLEADLNINFEDVEKDSFENMVENINVRREVRSDDDVEKQLLKLNPSKLQ